MIKIESTTLEEAYKDAAVALNCSVTQLAIEVVQQPKNGVLGFFKKNAIIVATIDAKVSSTKEQEKPKKTAPLEKVKKSTETIVEKKDTRKSKNKVIDKDKEINTSDDSHNIINDTIMPESFVSMQDDDDNDDSASYLANYDDEFDNVEAEDLKSTAEIAKIVQVEIEKLFTQICFNIESIKVSAHDENTLLIEFNGDDAALLIGKEGYRYKALSYMIFNWIIQSTNCNYV